MTAWLDKVATAREVHKRTFGETVQYTPEGGEDATDFVGIFDDQYEQVDALTGSRSTMTQPRLDVALADLPSGSRALVEESGDSVVVRGDAYTVIEAQHDGQGGALLFLHLAPEVE